MYSAYDKQELTDFMIVRAAQGHVNKMREFLREGADINGYLSKNIELTEEKRLYKGSTALTVAAGNGKENCLRILLKEGADPHQVNHFDSYALTLAAYYSEGGSRAGDVALKCVELLLKHGADVNAVHNGGASALTAVCKDFTAGHLPVVKRLIEAGANINYQSRHGFTPIMNALYSVPDVGLVLIRYLLEQGSDPMMMRNGKTAVDIAKDINKRDGISMDEAAELMRSFVENKLLGNAIATENTLKSMLF